METAATPLLAKHNRSGFFLVLGSLLLLLREAVAKAGVVHARAARPQTLENPNYGETEAALLILGCASVSPKQLLPYY